MGKVRIIAGQWRRRIIHFPDVEGLRPTHDRVRETVFNWLMPYIESACCLDLFSGTGAFGFEALSRGAARVTFVERNKSAALALQENARLLYAENYDILNESFPNIHLENQSFDIVFLDPPYCKGLLLESLVWVFPHCREEALVYFEAEKSLLLGLPEGFELYRHQSTSTLQYGLLRTTARR